MWMQYADGGLENDFEGLVGTVVVPSMPVTLTALCRFVAHGSNHTHDMYVVRASDNATLGHATWSAFASGGGDQYGFAYARLDSLTLQLQPGQAYYIVSSETRGGDYHYNLGPAVPCAGDSQVRSPVMGLLPAAAGVLQVTGSVYLAASDNGTWITNNEGTPRSLGPVSFVIQV
jgi:hypothetical protein